MNGVDVMRRFSRKPVLMSCMESSSSGFTLVELMIVISIMAIMVTPLIYLEANFYEGLLRTRHRQDMIEAGNRTLEWIAKDLRSVQGVMEKWMDESSQNDRLILSFCNEDVIVYRLDREKRVVTRTRYPSANMDLPQTTELALHVDAFEISPVAQDERVIDLRISMSRQLLNFREAVSMDGVAGRRVE